MIGNILVTFKCFMSTEIMSYSVSVCSEYFNKCYILIDLIHHVFDTLLPSWSFVDSVCELHKWNMISLHSKRENDFVGRYVQNKFNVTEKPYLYIGKYNHAIIGEIIGLYGGVPKTQKCTREYLPSQLAKRY